MCRSRVHNAADVTKGRPGKISLTELAGIVAPIARAVAPRLIAGARAGAPDRRSTGTASARARSQEPVTDGDLRRLQTLALERHAELVRQRPARRDILVMACVAQGAAVHRVTGRGGVKDFDVWLFYADRAGIHLNARPRATADFGPSPHGRRTAEPSRYRGRRVDLLARSIGVPPPFDSGAISMPWPDRVAAVRAWLATGAEGSSPWWLRQKPLVAIWPQERLGEVVHLP